MTQNVDVVLNVCSPYFMLLMLFYHYVAVTGVYESIVDIFFDENLLYDKLSIFLFSQVIQVMELSKLKKKKKRMTRTTVLIQLKQMPVKGNL